MLSVNCVGEMPVRPKVKLGVRKMSAVRWNSLGLFVCMYVLRVFPRRNHPSSRVRDAARLGGAE